MVWSSTPWLMRNFFIINFNHMPIRTESQKVDAILKQFDGLGFQSKQLIFLMMLGGLKANLPRSNPMRQLLDEIAKLTPKNKGAFKNRLANRRSVQNGYRNGSPVKGSPVKKSPSKPRSPPTPLSGSRRKDPNRVPGAVNLTNLPKWYYGPHFANKRI